MNTHIRHCAVATALILAAGCTGSGDAADAAETGSTQTVASMPKVDLGVAVARALRANPAATDSILAAYRLTRAGFDSLMYEIAADATLARAYTQAIR